MILLSKIMRNASAFLKSALFYFLIASGFFLSLAELKNYDIWWHLKTGEWIVNHLAVPHTQLFSYSIGDMSWVSHSWFFQTVIFLLYKFSGGVNALVFFRAILVALILWVTLKGFLKKVYFPLFLLTGWLFSALFLARMPIRPELVSALFFAACLYILFNKKNLWWLVLIQAVWVNMHGYAMLGPILLSLFILSGFIKDKIKLPFDWNKTRYLEDKRVYRKSLFILVISMGLFLFTPYHIKSLGYPFFAVKVFFHTAHNFYHISELSSFSLTDILYNRGNILLTYSIVLFLVSLLLNIQRADLLNILIFIVFSMLYFGANRHNGFFAIAVCFCILDNFKAGNLQPLGKYFKFRHVSILSLILTILVSFYITRHQFFKIAGLQKRYIYSKDFSSKSGMFGKSGSRYPEKAVDFMIRNNIEGPVFNSFNIGGYLIWRLYPQEKVFVDGRTEVYGKKFMDDYVHSIVDFENWQELDEKYGFNTVVLDYATTDFYYFVIKNLYKDKTWKLVYIGDVAVVFVKDVPINKTLIRLYDISFEDVQRNEEEDLDFETGQRQVYPEYFLNMARFFIDATGMPELALENLEKAKLINHECYEVYQLTGYTYFKMRRFEEAREAFIKSLEINPRIAEPYLNLGSVAAESGLYEDARSLYKQALRLDRNNKVARENLEKLP